MDPIEIALSTIAQVLAEQRASVYGLDEVGWNRTPAEVKAQCRLAALLAFGAVTPVAPAAPMGHA